MSSQINEALEQRYRASTTLKRAKVHSLSDLNLNVDRDMSWGTFIFFISVLDLPILIFNRTLPRGNAISYLRSSCGGPGLQ